MPNYVYDNTALLFPKTNLNPLPPGGDPTQYVQSVDWNTLNQAVDDVKGVLRGAQWYGVEKQAVDPGPVGVADYLWADVGGSLYFHTGGGDVLLTPAAATVTGASNVGIGAGSVGIFKQLSAGILELKGVRPASTKLSVVDAVGTNDVDIDVVEANLVHQNLSGAGTNDHVAIDAQLPTTVQKTDLGQLDGAVHGTIWFANTTGRVTRLGVGTDKQFLRTNGAAADPSWDNALVSVQDAGIAVTATPHAVLNFTGAGVSVADGGGGVATVTIAGAGAGNSLDAAYTLGQAIDVDLAAVSMSNVLSNTTNVLELSKAPGASLSGSALVATMDTFATSWAAIFNQPAIGNASAPTKGVLLRNTTPATTGATNEEFSPVLALVASAHDTFNPRTWTWAIQNQTVNAVSDESHLHFLLDDNAGGFFSKASLDNAGELTLGAGLVLGSGAVISSAGGITVSATNIAVTASGNLDLTGAAIGIFGATAAVQQTSGADLTNSVTAGGTDDTITDFTDLSTYATDAAAIRNAIYQLARKLKQVNDGLRVYGWLS